MNQIRPSKIRTLQFCVQHEVILWTRLWVFCVSGIWGRDKVNCWFIISIYYMLLIGRFARFLCPIDLCCSKWSFEGIFPLQISYLNCHLENWWFLFGNSYFRSISHRGNRKGMGQYKENWSKRTAKMNQQNVHFLRTMFI